MPYIGKAPADIIATAVDTTTGDFSGVVTANAGIKVDNITIDATEVDLSSGTFTIDSASDITLDADGGAVFFKDGGTEFGRIFNSASDLILKSAISDQDMKFQGNDGGSSVNALILDMSDAGTATFNHDIKLGDNGMAIFGAGPDLRIFHDGSNSYIEENGTGDLIVQTNGANFLVENTDGDDMIKAISDGAVEISHNNSKKFETTSTGVTVTGDIANASGALTLDIADDLIIDVAGSDIFLKKAGTTFASFKENSFDFRIQQEVQDKDIVFLGNDGGSADTEVARFDVSETALVLRDGGGSQANAGRIDIKTSGSVYNIIAIQTTRSATGTNFMEFFNSSGNSAGNINHNGSTTVNFNTSSDYRLKENVTYDFDATSRLKQLKPARFNFIDEPNTTIDGFLAHEAQEVVPIAVNGTKDEIKKWNKEEIEGGFAPDGASEGDNKLDDSGNPIPKYQGIDNSHLVPLLTKALQEQQATIEALTARIVTLENA